MLILFKFPVVDVEVSLFQTFLKSYDWSQEDTYKTSFKPIHKSYFVGLFVRLILRWWIACHVLAEWSIEEV